MKKTLISIALLGVIVVLTYWLYSIFAVTIDFQNIRADREKVVVERLKNIRTAQRAYRTKYGHFAPNFNELIGFINNDSLTMEMSIGSEDDSLAMARGLVKRYIYKVAVKDTLFAKDFKYETLRFIPFSVEATGSQKEFAMDTTSIKTESSVMVPVFEAYAPYVQFLGDLDEQELVNYIDERVNTLGKDAGLKVGSLTQTNNEAGNWE